MFDCDGEPLLVMASGADRADTDVLAKILAVNAITKGTPALVRAATGQLIGRVSTKNRRCIR